ncbi:MAG: hypothetical protein EOP07_01690 [Proteobacteria bacterium]|nr:MAG: hypothetical protein EOP07_01690 [Pseudomonadota bacterium]
MKLRHFTIIWLFILVFMSYEYLVLNRMIKTPSILSPLLCGSLENCKKLSPQSGKPLSYALGWIGFCTMAATNLYIIRKRSLSLQKFGSLQGWMNWHIFFGLLGPTLIVFHSNFKVGGLVSISFWSMVVSFLSGIVGRYFYIQLLQGKMALKKQIDELEAKFDTYEKLQKGRIHHKAMLAAKAGAFSMAGGLQGDELKQSTILSFLGRSVWGEMQLFLFLPPLPWKSGSGSRELRKQLKIWALLRKRLISMHYYQLLFGYWRSFHSPFAIWMYVVAIIHIASSLIFKVH